MTLRPTAIVLVSAALLLSSGCSILPESEPATLYRLPSSDIQPVTSDSMATRQRLAVAAPQAGHLLSSNRIVVYPEGNVVNVYEAARWQENAPALLQSRLITGLQQSRLFASVGSDSLPSERLLLSELRHFQSDYATHPPTVKVQLDVQLVSTQNRASIATQSFTTSAQAISTDIPDVVDAFGAASDDLTEQLVNWLANQQEANTLD
ncbi:ABC-type transport auxiliary lipoprotein family protein [Vreelandella neptunia]|uniref:ABC-type transport auxiliary lipoprotein family protein n=1 Tax=Vreelandella neptunia TaxID=115551 RepID=A0ABZ0YUA5_9GAMM|nr:ABC-type transport auxiliary lipoprotein family protein [Halomonas neptunia]MDN3562236.1 ABC-type transport auxiliary lipoprotein family protein [Halomonas neptunia]WQH14801.1 ABC-type transport auxiliary lipoprotein family protein [Halomonas neptunia]